LRQSQEIRERQNRQSNGISKLSLALALPSKSSSEDTIDIQNSTLNEIRGDYLRLSGELDNEHMESINELLEGEKRSILLDLGDVTLVGRKAVEFLARLEAAGVGIINCPEYVRTWIDAENNGERW